MYMLPLVLRYVAFQTSEQWEQENYSRLLKGKCKALVPHINFVKFRSIFLSNHYLYSSEIWRKRNENIFCIHWFLTSFICKYICKNISYENRYLKTVYNQIIAKMNLQTQRTQCYICTKF